MVSHNSHNSPARKEISKKYIMPSQAALKKISNGKKLATKAMSPPKSAFAKGRYTGSPGLGKKKDNRHELVIEGLMAGVVVAYIKKSFSEEEPFLAYDYTLIRTNQEIMDTLEINDTVFRKGINGETPKPQCVGSNYSWRQFLFIVGEEDNTVEKRSEIGNRLKDHLNQNANITNYRYPISIKLGNDRTIQDNMRPLDSCILNDDVIGLINTAFPGTLFSDLVQFEELMGTFWGDIDDGRNIMIAAEQDVEENNI